MNIQAALKSQYHAALAMLRQTIERCPEDLWISGEHPRTFWRIAYHALFFTHLYLQSNEAAFRPWERHREDCDMLYTESWRSDHEPEVVVPYSKGDLLEYLDLLDAMIDDGVDGLDLAAPESGFPWYQMPKLDHQILNIRHLQQHTGQLSELSYAAGVGLDWMA